MVIYVPKMGEIVEDTQIESFVTTPTSESSSNQSKYQLSK